MVAILLGAFLVICGVLYMAKEALSARRLSQSPQSSRATPDVTLEPRHQGVAFFGFRRNWPGIVLMAAGATLLLLGAGT
jgi:hypothetical protein